MKEKRYTLPEEQKDAAFAAEPAPAYHGNAAIALPEDECAEEDIDWNKIPVGCHRGGQPAAPARCHKDGALHRPASFSPAFRRPAACWPARSAR